MMDDEAIRARLDKIDMKLELIIDGVNGDETLFVRVSKIEQRQSSDRVSRGWLWAAVIGLASTFVPGWLSATK